MRQQFLLTFTNQLYNIRGDLNLNRSRLALLALAKFFEIYNKNKSDERIQNAVDRVNELLLDSSEYTNFERVSLEVKYLKFINTYVYQLNDRKDVFNFLKIALRLLEITPYNKKIESFSSYLVYTIKLSDYDRAVFSDFLTRSDLKVKKFIELLLYFNKSFLSYDEISAKKFMDTIEGEAKTFKIKIYRQVIKSAIAFDLTPIDYFALMPRSEGLMINFLLYTFIQKLKNEELPIEQLKLNIK